MAKSTLRRMVDQRDRDHAVPSRLEPERLVLPARPPARPRQICLDCRRDPYEIAHAAFMERYVAADANERRTLQQPDARPGRPPACPACGGYIVEVEI